MATLKPSARGAWATVVFGRESGGARGEGVARERPGPGASMWYVLGCCMACENSLSLFSQSMKSVFDSLVQTQSPLLSFLLKVNQAPWYILKTKSENRSIHGA